jgi:osmotically-inducible protein OsmY
VHKGFVTISGTIFEKKQRRALQVLVENVHGVKGVRDHLSEYIGETARETA